jgi:hypothetical protein
MKKTMKKTAKPPPHPPFLRVLSSGLIAIAGCVDLLDSFPIDTKQGQQAHAALAAAMHMTLIILPPRLADAASSHIVDKCEIVRGSMASSRTSLPQACGCVRWHCLTSCQGR